MKFRIVILIVFSMMTGLHAFTVHAQDVSSRQTNASEDVVDVANRICPVEGTPVNGDHYVIYKGKRYGVCCKECEREFLKDPEKYIEKLRARGELK